MLFFEWSISWLERRLGTMIELPAYAKEFVLPKQLLDATKAKGWCLHRSLVPKICMKILRKTPDRDIKRLKFVRDLLLAVEDLPEEITHIVILSDMNTHGMFSISGALSYRLTQNHERFHTLTIWRSLCWHVELDRYMWEALSSKDGNPWCDCISALLESEPYKTLIADDNDEPKTIAWYAAEEMLSRIGTVLHVPRNLRANAARQQLPRAPGRLLKVAEFVETHWVTAEQLVGWFDAVYSSRATRRYKACVSDGERCQGSRQRDNLFACKEDTSSARPVLPTYVS